MLNRIKRYLNNRRGWISVKDSLPREGEHVLTYRDFWPTYRVNYIADCNGLKWMMTEPGYTGKIVYWKYIKSPYETL